MILNLFMKAVDLYFDKPFNKYKFDGIEEVKDIVYDTDNKKVCRLDVYRMKKEGKQPVFLNIHGGAFVAGGRWFRRGFSRYIASLGYAVVNISYGLAPKHPYPEFVRHAYAALKWIENNGKEYAFDLNRVVISGDSAGAYLASAVAALAVNGKYREELKLQETKIRPAAAVLYSGIYDLRYALSQKTLLNMQKTLAKTAFGIKSLDEAYLASYPSINSISPYDYVNEAYPPVFLSHSDADNICTAQGARMCGKLREHGVSVWEFHAVKTKCLHCWHLTQEDSAAKAVLDSTAEFLKSLDGKKTENRYIEI